MRVSTPVRARSADSPAIEIRGLDFRYRRDHEPVLRDLRLRIERGWRCLLVGANGAGKTTLLRVVAGKHLVAPGSLRVLGRPAFDDTSLADEVALIGDAFPFHADVRVGELLERRAGVDPSRRGRLVEILGVDVDWHMPRVSDGQRRRVQILLGLLRPSRILLLDEVTSDLDVVARHDLLQLLREESDERGVTILHATHILDAMETWATHLAHLRDGRLVTLSEMDAIPDLVAERARGTTAPLERVVLGWLRAEKVR